MMPLIAFLLFTHARLQDIACAMSRDSYAVLGNQRGNPRNSREIRKSAGNHEISDSTGNHWQNGEIWKSLSYAETARVGPLGVDTMSCLGCAEDDGIKEQKRQNEMIDERLREEKKARGAQYKLLLLGKLNSPSLFSGSTYLTTRGLHWNADRIAWGYEYTNSVKITKI